MNGHTREMKLFKKLSTYIMQEDLLQPRLTVQESMIIAANLKLGKELGKAEKELIVRMTFLFFMACFNSSNVGSLNNGADYTIM